MALFGGVIGYWVRSKIDHSTKKKDLNFTHRRDAMDLLQPILAGLIESSDRLMSSPGYLANLGDLIEEYQTNVRKLFKYQRELSEGSIGIKHNFAPKTANQIEEINSLVSEQCDKLSDTFCASQDFREDPEEMHRIMKEGMETYTAAYTELIKLKIKKLQKSLMAESR